MDEEMHLYPQCESSKPINLPLQAYLLEKLQANLAAYGDGIWMTNYTAGKTMRYSEVIPTIEMMMSTLKKDGFKKGDFVIFCANNDMNFVLAKVAIWCCGGGVTFIAPGSAIEAITERCQDVSAKFIICDEDTAESALKVASLVNGMKAYSLDPIQGCPSLVRTSFSSDVQESFADGCKDVDLDQVILVLYTSGTTGKPKGVMHTHRTWTAGLNIFNSLLSDGPIQPGRKRLFINRMFHVSGAAFAALSLIAHEHNIIMKHYTDERFLQAISEMKPFFVTLSPTQIGMFAKSSDLGLYDLTSITVVFTGGSLTNPGFFEALYETLKNLKTILLFYATSETGCIALNSITSLTGNTKSCGKPYQTCAAKILDLITWKSLPPNSTGEIYIKNDTLFRGYINNSAAFSECMRDGWYGTGDAGFIDQEGHLYVQCRVKDLIKYRKSIVIPSEIEFFLQKHPAVQDAIVVGKPDEQYGELPAAFVVVRKDSEITEETLCNYIKENLPDHCRLRGGVHFMSTLPRNVVGKPYKKTLVEHLTKSA